MTVTAVVYSGEGIARSSPVDAEDLAALRGADGTTWVRVTDGTTAELDLVGEAFDVHDLEREDVAAGERPKVEEHADHTFVLATAATLRGGDTTFREELRTEAVGLFFGDGWLVTLSTERLAAVQRVWDAVDAEHGRVVERGPDFTVYRILDELTAGYEAVLDELEDDIEYVEGAVLERPDEEILERINSIRRELLAFRRVAWPMRTAVRSLARGDTEAVAGTTERYYRDVSDELVHTVELAETYRDLASGARDVYLNALSASTNEAMKRLTIVATVVLPLTLVAGIYGMNFERMPELGWPYAYPATMVGMVAVAALMIEYFRREGWL